MEALQKASGGEAGAAGLEGDAQDATRGGGSSRPSAAGEGGTVSKRRRGRFEKVRVRLGSTRIMPMLERSIPRFYQIVQPGSEC